MDEWLASLQTLVPSVSGYAARACSFRGCAPICNHAHDVRFGCELSVNFRLTAHPLDARADANGCDFDGQSVAGCDWAAKARVINAAEEDELFIAVFDLAQSIDRADLRHRFDDEHAGHDGRAGKMSLKEGFVDGDLLEADDALARHKLDDAINEQERIAVRDDLLNRARVVNDHKSE